jgi:hypothetical protein
MLRAITSACHEQTSFQLRLYCLAGGALIQHSCRRSGYAFGLSPWHCQHLIRSGRHFIGIWLAQFAEHDLRNAPGRAEYQQTTA